jgi:hypothetical protein
MYFILAISHCKRKCTIRLSANEYGFQSTRMILKMIFILTSLFIASIKWIIRACLSLVLANKITYSLFSLTRRISILVTLDLWKMTVWVHPKQLLNEKLFPQLPNCWLLRWYHPSNVNCGQSALLVWIYSILSSQELLWLPHCVSTLDMTYSPLKNSLVENIVDKEMNWRINWLRNYNYISNCSSFSQQQTTVGMRPSTTALSEMYSHLGGR